MWGCWYELIYVGAAFIIAATFCVLVAFSVFRWKPDLMIKILALAGLSALQLLAAFLASELIIDYFDNFYSCQTREIISLTTMLTAMLVILAVSFSVHSQKHVINRFADIFFCLICISIVLGYVTFEVIL